MEERIEINGVWYVKETPKQETEKFEELVRFEGLVYENDTCCFEVSRHYKDDCDEFYDGIYIDITIKKGGRENWVKEYIDNDLYLLSVLNDNLEPGEEFDDKDVMDYLKIVALDLVKREWIQNK